MLDKSWNSEFIRDLDQQLDKEMTTQDHIKYIT